MPMLTDEQRTALEQAAKDAAGRSYAPYSRFPVGAAVLCATGKIYAGCNVENASFGLTLCAERAAVAQAVAAGERELTAVAIYTPTAVPTPPCGACRQVLAEFGPEALVLCLCAGGERLETRLSALLPSLFTPQKNLHGGDAS
jgi:cytidine deaminase